MCLLCGLYKFKMEHKCDVRKKVIFAALAGVTAGVAAGLLLAPKTGKENREEISKTIGEWPDRLKKLSVKAGEKVEETKAAIIGEIHNEEHSHFQKPTEISAEQVDAFKNKLK